MANFLKECCKMAALHILCDQIYVIKFLQKRTFNAIRVGSQKVFMYYIAFCQMITGFWELFYN